MADNKIAERLALITGASGGIGAACARQLAAKGVNLALTYSSNRANIDSLVNDLVPKTNGSIPKAPIQKVRISIHQVDMASVDQIKHLFKEIQREHGVPVDILIPNAGYGKRIKNVEDIPLEEFEHTLNVNLRAPFLLVQGVVKGMKEQRWGRIVFTSSIAAYGAGINGCHYAASKGGMGSMSKRLASQLAEYGISVNDVAPAMVGATGLIPNAEAVPGVVESIPMGRLCEPEEVANAVLMFVTTGFATGQSLIIAGGLK